MRRLARSITIYPVLAHSIFILLALFATIGIHWFFVWLSVFSDVFKPFKSSEFTAAIFAVIAGVGTWVVGRFISLHDQAEGQYITPLPVQDVLTKKGRYGTKSLVDVVFLEDISRKVFPLKFKKQKEGEGNALFVLVSDGKTKIQPLRLWVLYKKERCCGGEYYVISDDDFQKSKRDMNIKGDTYVSESLKDAGYLFAGVKEHKLFVYMGELYEPFIEYVGKLNKDFKFLIGVEFRSIDTERVFLQFYQATVEMGKLCNVNDNSDNTCKQVPVLTGCTPVAYEYLKKYLAPGSFLNYSRSRAFLR